MSLILFTPTRDSRTWFAVSACHSEECQKMNSLPDVPEPTDPSQGVKMTRPLCAYPQIAKYKGSGDTNDAANFVCAQPNSAQGHAPSPQDAGLRNSERSR